MLCSATHSSANKGAQQSTPCATQLTSQMLHNTVSPFSGRQQHVQWLGWVMVSDCLRRRPMSCLWRMMTKKKERSLIQRLLHIYTASRTGKTMVCTCVSPTPRLPAQSLSCVSPRQSERTWLLAPSARLLLRLWEVYYCWGSKTARKARGTQS